MGSPDSTVIHIFPEQQAVEHDVVARVVTSFDATADPRLRQLIRALARHLHSLIREVRLTEQEWTKASKFLTAVGHTTNDKRQEFILLSDILGASMHTIAVNNEVYQDATEATVFGPFSLITPLRCHSAATSPLGLLGSHARSRAPSPTPTASRSPAPGLRC